MIPPSGNAKVLPFDEGGKRRRLPVDADKIGRIGVFQFHGRPLRREPAPVQNDDVIGFRRLFHIVRGEKDGQPRFPAEAVDAIPDRFARLRIQPRGRLVQNEDLGPVQQRAGDVDPPPLSARQLAERAFQKPVQGKKGRKLFQPRGVLPARKPVQPRAETQVVGDGKFPVQDAILKDDADFGLRGGASDFGVPVHDHFAVVLVQHAAEDIDRRALARAVDAEKGEKLPFPHLKRQIVHRFDVAEIFF